MNKAPKILSLLGAFFLFSTIIKVAPSNARLQNALFEISEQSGQYHENEIVVSGLSKSHFLKLAKQTESDYILDQLGTTTGRLFLNSNTSIKEIYQKFPHLLPSFSLNYNAYVAGRTILNPANEPNYISNQSYLRHINVPTTWSKTKGEGLTIAVIDTGINYRHQEFKDSLGNSIITSNSYSIDENKSVAQYGYEVIDDTYFHGTMVAGLIAAQINDFGIAGIAPDVNLMIIKCDVNENGQFSSGTTGLSNGLQYAIDNGADIINMSVETTSNVFSSRLQTAVQKGIIVVGSAGNGVYNSGSGTYIGTTLNRYPAADKNCIGVGALDTVTDLTTEYIRATYSNYGNNTTVVAPGTGIYSTWKYETSANRFGNANGTSFACPMVTGIIALYKSLHPTADFEEINALLQASSKDIGTLGKDLDFGYGLIDADALINGEKGTLTFDYLDSNVSNTTHPIIKGHTSQIAPLTIANEREIEGWYYTPSFSGSKYNPYVDILNADTTLYANYVDGTGVSVGSISVNPTSISLIKGNTKQLDVTILPSNATNKSLTYYSSNDNIATVSSSGLVTAISAGTALITITSVGDNSKTATCEIIVMEYGSLTITRSSFKAGVLSYGTNDDWTAVTTSQETITGQADLYSSNGQTTMQTRASSSISMYHNIDPLPGPITGISIEYGTDASSRTYYAYASAVSKISKTSDGTNVGSLIVSSSNKNPKLTISEINDYRYFSVNLTADASFINSITIDYIYTVATSPTKNLESLESSGSLAKSIYYVGEVFDPTGLQFIANYDDDSYEIIDYENLIFTPLSLSLENTSIEVSYQEGDIIKSTIITGITVLEIPLTNLESFIRYLETITCENIHETTTYTQLSELYARLSSSELEQLSKTTLSDGSNAFERYEYFVFIRMYKEASASPFTILLNEENTQYLFGSLILIATLLGITYLMKKRRIIES